MYTDRETHIEVLTHMVNMLTEGMSDDQKANMTKESFHHVAVKRFSQHSFPKMNVSIDNK